ncbi:uncharacterized protein GLRG_01268 [Colletotrichum graminicola M1.001]|uniref:Uncharacterized protein n=1 Tax=Colletotrichum graminicola (strain M1.001 / M2 / FGSC 10212) TaxID=645133 RepID=E3Q4V9_COLGM|nr:uncharacterized protein GLRG_01268 [Colletotrichum graminicola M1.001]EFQ26124.1 hypothetical protein GLRG_01268 [Colletotrichum graminicola M1.001]
MALDVGGIQQKENEDETRSPHQERTGVLTLYWRDAQTHAFLFGQPVRYLHQRPTT